MLIYDMNLLSLNELINTSALISSTVNINKI